MLAAKKQEAEEAATRRRLQLDAASRELSSKEDEVIVLRLEHQCWLWVVCENK